MTRSGIDYRQPDMTGPATASDAWVDTSGGFYAVDDYGHAAMARRIVQRTMDRIPYWRHLGGCTTADCEGPDAWSDRIVRLSDGTLGLDHSSHIDPTSALESAGWAHCSLGTIRLYHPPTPRQIDTLFDMVACWVRQYGEGHSSYVRRVADYRRSLIRVIEDGTD
jgi:hypothetical protein